MGKEDFQENVWRGEGGRGVATQNKLRAYGVVWRVKYNWDGQISTSQRMRWTFTRFPRQ